VDLVVVGIMYGSIVVVESGAEGVLVRVDHLGICRCAAQTREIAFSVIVRYRVDGHDGRENEEQPAERELQLANISIRLRTKGMYQTNAPSPTIVLLSLQPSPHLPVLFQLATAAKALSHIIMYMASTAVNPYGCAYLRVRGKRGVIVS
jgi:hypothetical protein